MKFSKQCGPNPRTEEKQRGFEQKVAKEAKIWSLGGTVFGVAI